VEFPPEPAPWSAEPGPGAGEWIASAVLLIVTILSTSLAGVFYSVGDIAALRLLWTRPGIIAHGLVFSVPLISILLAHELGHYLACRYYGMRCTPPFFIPAPIPVTGTFGAFIRIKSQFRHKRALFDIGVAGPLAGFAFALPALWIGIRLSTLVPKGALGRGALSFGEPLILRLLGELALGYAPNRQDIVAHPIAMAAWVGIFATSLNLLPIWQLDGGHIAYAIWGRYWQKRISIAALAGLMLLCFQTWPPTPSYLLFGLLLLVIGARVRFYHPPTLLEGDELGPGRVFIALLALLILILSFIPIPIAIT
jgi:membrane-associated protease RseP (regulator of RpoE activity)